MKPHLVLAVAVLAFGSATAFGAQTATPALKSGADDDTMKAFVAATCTTCHEISVLGATPHTAGQWSAILDRMASYHPPLAAADLKALGAWLAKTYPEPAK